MKNLLLFISFILTVSAAGAQGAVKLYRYFNAGNKDHFFTTNWQELGEGKYGFTLESVAGYVMTTQFMI